MSPQSSTENAALPRPQSDPSSTQDHPAVRLDALRALLLHESDLVGRWQDAMKRQAAASARRDATAAERGARAASRLLLQIDEAKRRRAALVGALRDDVMAVW